MKKESNNEFKLIKDFITKINNGTINNKNKAENEFRKLKQKVTSYDLIYDFIEELEKICLEKILKALNQKKNMKKV